MKKHQTSISIGVLFIGIAFIAIGLLRGENQTVFMKAVNICMECIGLG